MNVISQQCRALFGALGDMSQLWRDVVHPFMVEHWRLQFNTAGSQGGRSWAGLEPKYAASQMALGDSIVPLEVSRSARLEPSFVNPTSAEHIFSFSKNSMQAGSSVPYASSLATGGTGPFGETYPSRDPRVMTPGQIDDLRALVFAWFRSKYGGR